MSSRLSPSSPAHQANLPLLQRELLHCARLAKQTPAQYLAQHEQLLLDANASSPIDSSELLLDVNDNGKRRTPDRYPHPTPSTPAAPWTPESTSAARAQRPSSQAEGRLLMLCRLP